MTVGKYTQATISLRRPVKDSLHLPSQPSNPKRAPVAELECYNCRACHASITRDWAMDEEYLGTLPYLHSVLEQAPLRM